MGETVVDKAKLSRQLYRRVHLSGPSSAQPKAAAIRVLEAVCRLNGHCAACLQRCNICVLLHRHLPREDQSRNRGLLEQYRYNSGMGPMGLLGGSTGEGSKASHSPRGEAGATKRRRLWCEHVSHKLPKRWCEYDCHTSCVKTNIIAWLCTNNSSRPSHRRTYFRSVYQYPAIRGRQSPLLATDAATFSHDQVLHTHILRLVRIIPHPKVAH